MWGDEDQFVSKTDSNSFLQISVRINGGLTKNKNECQIEFNDSLDLKNILKKACSKFGGSYKSAKLYNKDGVCLFEEDIKNVVTAGDVLYVATEGENFNYCAILDEYELGKVLGEGGFGKVLLGKHKETKEKVAIKFSDMSSELGSASAIQAIYKEAESLKSLVHKHIIKLHHAFLEQK